MVALGYRPDIEDRRDYPARMRLPQLPVRLPNKHSWRRFMTAIRDQGNLGSCVGFACSAIKEFQEVQQRPYTPFKNTSEMWIYWKAKEIDAWPTLEGTSIRDALKVLHDVGVPTERAWPYTDKKARGNEPPTQPAFWSKIVARWAKISRYYRLNSLQHIKEWLYLNGPVVIGIPVGDTIFNPTSHVGVEEQSFVALPRSFVGGHAIVLTGFDEQYKVLQFKNSWGINWGYHGYGYIPYHYLDHVHYDAWALHDD